MKKDKRMITTTQATIDPPSVAAGCSTALWKAGDKVVCTHSSPYGCKAGRSYVVQKAAKSEWNESGWWLWLDGLIGWADSIRFRKVS